MTRSSSRGFTLIELLVVIAIIAILAAILFPVFARARAKARQVSCNSNLRQLGMSMLMYAQDHRELLPTWGYSTTGADHDATDGPAEGFYSWDTVIMPYLRNVELLRCPDNPHDRRARGYAMPRYVSDPYGNGTPLWIDRPPAPVETVLLTEKGKHPPGSHGDAAMEAFYQSHSATGWGLETEMFHNNGKNFLYLDGHVSFHSEGSGPFAHDSGRTCPPEGLSGWEEHGPGHCEFYTDWPR